MKIAINHTLEVSDEQRTIGGVLLKAKEFRALVSNALVDLVAGETVTLANYGIDAQLQDLFSNPAVAARARELLLSPTPGPKATKDSGDPEDPLSSAAAEPEPDEEWEVDGGCNYCGKQVVTEDRCERCSTPLHEGCRAQAVGEVIEQYGPLPKELRVGADGQMPFVCGRCLESAFEQEPS